MTRTATAPPSPEQLVLDLGNRPALGAEDFLLSGSNATAVGMIDGWPDWPASAVLVAGPEGCGKSHLVNVWRLRSGAEQVAAATLDDDALSRHGAAAALAIEDLDRGIGSEKALFHLLNMAREHRRTLLLTSRLKPGELTIALPDLRSRLRALPVVIIAEPDEGLLGAVLVKLLADRQLQVAPQAIAYMARHMERSMASANRLVEAVDARSLAQRRPITRAMAAEVLAELDPSKGGHLGESSAGEGSAVDDPDLRDLS